MAGMGTILAGALAPEIGKAIVPLGAHLITTMFGGSLGPRVDGLGKLMGAVPEGQIAHGTLRPWATRQQGDSRDAKIEMDAANAARKAGLYTEEQRQAAHLNAIYTATPRQRRHA